MPGIKWTTAEKSILRSLRKAGRTVTEIVADPEVLPGRTADALRQLLRRKGWVNAEASQRAKDIEKLDGEQHEQFVQFIRKFSTAPLEQIASSWNNWAKGRSWPTISVGMVLYWIEKLHLPHDRKAALDSAWSVRKRDKNRGEKFKDRLAALRQAVALDLASTKAAAKRYHREHKRVEMKPCGNCNNSWPVTEEYFAHLPASFAFGGTTLTGFQIEFCKFCDRSCRDAILLHRGFKKSTDSYTLQRREQRRKGIDAAFAELKDGAVETAARLLRRNRTMPRRSCVRCCFVLPLSPDLFPREPRNC